MKFFGSEQAVQDNQSRKEWSIEKKVSKQGMEKKVRRQVMEKKVRGQ